MSPTSDLFRRTTKVFTAHPVLWLPLLLADVLRSLVLMLSRPLTRAALIASAPHSVLGGGIAGLPSPTKIALIGGSIGFVATALGLLFYLYALGVIARAVGPDAPRSLRKPLLHTETPDGLWPTWLRISGLALLYVLLSGTLLSALSVRWGARLHLKPAIAPWVAPAIVLPLIALVLYLSIRPLRRFVLRVQEQPFSRCGSARPYLLLLILSTAVATLATLGMAYLTRSTLPALASSGTLLVLQIFASAVTAFPYAYALTGLSLSPELAIGE